MSAPSPTDTMTIGTGKALHIIESLALNKALCGRSGERISTTLGEIVTCKSCMAKHMRLSERAAHLMNEDMEWSILAAEVEEHREARRVKDIEAAHEQALTTTFYRINPTAPGTLENVRTEALSAELERPAVKAKPFDALKDLIRNDFMDDRAYDPWGAVANMTLDLIGAAYITGHSDIVPDDWNYRPSISIQEGKSTSYATNIIIADIKSGKITRESMAFWLRVLDKYATLVRRVGRVY